MALRSLKIHKLGPLGDGISLSPQGPIFIEGVAPGEIVSASIQRDNKGTLRGTVSEVLKPSSYRQRAPCAFYEKCGNCTAQHLQDSFYQKWKVQIVKEALETQKVFPKKWLPPVFLGSESRRRVTFSAIKQNGKVKIGYYRRRSNQIEAINSCLVTEPEIFNFKEHLSPLLKNILIENKSIDIFLQRVGNDLEAVFIGELSELKKSQNKIKEWAQKAPIQRVSFRDTQLQKTQLLFEKKPLISTFGTLEIKLPPAAFLQPTLNGEQALSEAVMASIKTKGNFADLFSGCGTFAGRLLERGAVDAFESVPEAVAALSQAGKKKPLKVFRRDLFKNPLSKEELNRYEAVVFDPPRAGCEAQARNMAYSKVPLLIGVSCNAATFARDAKILCSRNYQLQTLQIVDQFLWSHHVEVVGVFIRRKKSCYEP